MKVKELIKELQKQDPEKEVMIQQGEEFDYMSIQTVKEMYVDMDEEMILSVVIKHS